MSPSFLAQVQRRATASERRTTEQAAGRSGGRPEAHPDEGIVEDEPQEGPGDLSRGELGCEGGDLVGHDLLCLWALGGVVVEVQPRGIQGGPGALSGEKSQSGLKQENRSECC
jgi:hypothetical protein